MTLFSQTSLPQFDSKPEKRLEKLEEFRQKFQYDFSVVDQVPISASIPDEAKAGTLWNLKIVATQYQIRRNWEKILEDKDYVFEFPLPEKPVSEIAKMLIDGDLLNYIRYTNPDLGVALKDKRPSSFTQYYELFKQFDIPEGGDKLFDDGEFADYFVAGLNPVMIQKLTALQDNYGFNDDHVNQHPKFADDSIEGMIADERLFVVDYFELALLKDGQHPDQPKYGYRPIVFLAVPKNGDNLEILAIQNEQGADALVLTPFSGKWDWLIAKTMVKVADSNYHEVVSHLGLTHLLIDPIVIATFRQLAPQHPLHTLLVPHFEGTLPINALAVKTLLPKGGTVEQLLSAEIETGYEVLRIKRNSFHFRDNLLPANLKARGVDSSSKIKNYPYRDDGLLVWNAIQDWVSDYVDLYYNNDSDVANDNELAAWTSEIMAPDAGRVNGFAPSEGIITKQVLVETLTMILFTCSAQHAAVNFPQGRASAVAYQPLAGYQPAPTTEGLDEQGATEFLPPLDRAIKQVHTLHLLGQTYYTQLGQYNLGTFSDKRVVPKLWKFQLALRGVESTIKDRNKTRRTSYEYLVPSKIPQSINI